MKTMLSLFIGICLGYQADAMKPPKKANNAFSAPAGTVKIADNFYADRYELSNLNYREYLAWLKRVHGPYSQPYQQALPDTLVWTEVLAYSEPFVEHYFDHPAYDDFPMVGLSPAQAMDYAAWRSDRVYEQLLLKKKRIQSKDYAHLENADNYFSIERYRSGQFFGYTPDLSLPVPRYRIPTPEEWEQLTRGAKTTENINSFDLSDGIAYTTAPVDAYKASPLGLFNLLGNVAEMTDKIGISKGGSYIQPAEKCQPSEQIPYEKPTAWLGVRLVCSWE